jgi:glycosyltransferase involved in cell wall biosynthesis
MHVVMLTPQVNPMGWVTGFIHGWIDALARHERVDQLDVICLEMGPYDLPANVTVTSMGKEQGYSRLRELFELERAIASVIGRADVLFGHMIPRFTLFAAPWAKLFGVPIVQWYTHRHVTPELRIVHALADRLVTASPESFTLPSAKVTSLGHGIDTERFRPADDASAGTTGERLIVAAGRLSPIKHYDVLIEAVARLATRPGFGDVRAIVAGGSTPEHGEAYAEQLRRLARDRGVGERITFAGIVPHQDMPELYRRATVTVNLCPTGGVDKAVLESMASGVPVVVRNETFLPLLGDDASGLWCEAPDPDLVADRLAGVLEQPPGARAALGRRLRQRMQADYALEGFIGRLVGVFEEVVARRGRGRP